MTETRETQATFRIFSREAAVPGMGRTVVLLSSLMTGMLLATFQGPGFVSFLSRSGASMEMQHVVYLLWCVNGALVLLLGAQRFPQLPVGVGLLACALGGALAFGPVQALGTIAILSLGGLAMRMRHWAAVEATLSRRLTTIAAPVAA